MRALLLCLTLFLTTACASGGGVATAGAVNAAGARIAPPIGSWRLAAFADRDGVVAPEVTLVVQADGKVGGSGGCNGYFSRWTLGDGQSTLGPVGATRRMCQDEVMEVEGRYFDALSRVAGWRPTDGGITLFDADDAPLLVFRPQD